MKQVLEHEAYPDRHDEPHRDLVLGAPALLGIFFVLALICAVCFGFGYSTRHIARPQEQQLAAIPETPQGRQPMPLGGSPSAAMDQPETTDAAPDVPTPVRRSAITKPVPGQSEGPEAQAWPPDQANSQPADRMSPDTPNTPAAIARRNAASPGGYAPASKPSPITPSSSTLAANEAGAMPLPAISATQTATSGAGLMVQIAAVTRAADAQTLSLALRHDGFAAIVRTATDDRFFHVQVGPFPSVQAAKAMRSRLADSGYNAFIKP